MSIQSDYCKRKCENCNWSIWDYNRRLCMKYIDIRKEVKDDDVCDDFQNGVLIGILGGGVSNNEKTEI